MKQFLFFIFTIVGWYSNGQTITIGSGTAINGITTASPVNIDSRRQVSQTVYTAAELNAAGITGPATINQMGYFITNIPIYNIPGYTIQMKHTTATNAGGNLNGGYTTVKNAFTYNPGQGDWDMIPLDVPFLWNGTQNIAIRICWSQVQPSSDPSGQLRIFNSNRGYKYRRDNSAGSICGSTPNIRVNTKPQIRFIFETETVWTGAVSTDWFDNSNWTAKVPDETMDVRVPVGVPNNPNLTGVGLCNNLILEGVMTLSASGTINVHGDFINTGTYTDLGGVTKLTGVGPNTIDNAGSLTIANLVFDSDNGGVVSGGNITISEELQVNKTTLNTNDLIIMKSDATQTARIDELVTDCFYTLNMQDAWGDGWNGGILTILEDGVVVGTYQAYAAATTEIVSLANGANIELSYSSGSYENENTYQLIDPNGVTVFSDGGNPSTGIVFTTTPSCSFTAPITGNIIMERHIDTGETYWRFFSSAVQGATIADYQDDFITAGYAGSAFPNFGWVSIYNYDETLGAGLGYVPVASAGQVLQPGEGFMVWSGDTITGTQPFTIDLEGEPNQGDIIMPVTFTNTGTSTEDGWNLVGNPYASTVDWESPNWTKVNMANATYILNPDNEQYATYVNGASVNGGSRYIASQQAFWVYAMSSGPSLIAREGTKSSIDQAFLKNSNISPGINISVNGFGMTDECIMRHVDGSSDAFDFEYDAYKINGSSGTYPQISLINTTNEELVVHSFDKQFQEWEIPVKVIVFQNGFYDLVFNNVTELNVPCLKLEDTYTGEVYSIIEGQAINIELSDTTTQARFILRVGKNYETLTNSVLCNGDANGSIEIDLEDNSNVNYNITSSIEVTNGNANGNPLLIEDLTAGTYTVEVASLQNLCATTNFTFVVPSPSPLSVMSVIVNELNGFDGNVALNVNGGTAPYVYDWNNGDTGNEITDITEGTYSVIVKDNNNCSWTDEFVVGSALEIDDEIEDTESLTINYILATNEITISGLKLKEDSEVKIYSVNGDLIEVYTISYESKESVYKLKKPLAKGVYVVRLNNKSYKFIY